ncbi:MAG: hypothetical protein AAF567_10485 [Actinomycetota bacterium]
MVDTATDPGHDETSARDQVCTAFATTATSDRNFLFTPPCSCPRCAPDEIVDERGPGTMWLTIDGRRVRRDVEALPLGAEGRSLLGDQPEAP